MVVCAERNMREYLLASSENLITELTTGDTMTNLQDYNITTPLVNYQL
jgi:hypothetical protein